MNRIRMCELALRQVLKEVPLPADWYIRDLEGAICWPNPDEDNCIAYLHTQPKRLDEKIYYYCFLVYPDLQQTKNALISAMNKFKDSLKEVGA